jgi:hypothetical protein
MPDDPKQPVLESLRELREALSLEPLTDTVTKARHHCDRLEQAISLAHAEGLRFAAYTLLKLFDPASAPQSAAISQARAHLKAALEAGQFPH